MVARRIKKEPRLPQVIEPTELGRRLRRALVRAGYETQMEAVATIQNALPNSRFVRQDLSAMIQGQTMPKIGRVLTIVYLLGLDPRIIFRELFDVHGQPISRMSHPAIFRDGCRSIPESCSENLPSA